MLVAIFREGSLWITMPSGDISQPIANRALSVIPRADGTERVVRTGHGSTALCVCFRESGFPLLALGWFSGTGQSLETDAGHQESPQSDARERHIV
jgi:hypothetical protein